MYAFFALPCTVFGWKSKHKTDVTAWHGIHFQKNNLWNILVIGNYYANIQNYQNLMILTFSDTKWTLMHPRNYIYTGTPNLDMCILCTVKCGRNVNKPSAPTEIEGKGLKLWCDITVQQKTSLYIKLKRIHMIFGFLVNIENTKEYIFITPLGPFSLKNDALPLNFLFWSPPLQYTDLTHQIWRFLVYIFLGSILI